MVWGLSGKGLRTTISLEGYYNQALAGIGQINIGKVSIPTGTILFFALLAFGIWAFLHTKTGRVRKGRRHQRRQDPHAVRGYVHLACRGRHSGV